MKTAVLKPLNVIVCVAVNMLYQCCSLYLHQSALPRKIHTHDLITDSSSIFQAIMLAIWDAHIWIYAHIDARVHDRARIHRPNRDDASSHSSWHLSHYYAVFRHLRQLHNTHITDFPAHICIDCDGLKERLQHRGNYKHS